MRSKDYKEVHNPQKRLLQFLMLLFIAGVINIMTTMSPGTASNELLRHTSRTSDQYPSYSKTLSVDEERVDNNRRELIQPEPEKAAAKIQPAKTTNYLDALRDCQTLQCLSDAYHFAKRDKNQYAFPHFFIVGWQKAATSSLFWYLYKHPNIQGSYPKEPEYFTADCKGDPLNGCSLESQQVYLNQTLRLERYIKAKGTVAVGEASTHYGLTGETLAPKLRQVLPWIKIIINLREPISRAMSMLIHLADVKTGHSQGCLAKEKNELYYCLKVGSQLSPRKTTGRTEYMIGSARNYSVPVRSWFANYPREQIHMVQYERLVSEEAEEEELTKVKEFLEVDISLPEQDMERHNSRKHRIKPDGWPMKAHEYLELVEMVRDDAKDIAQLAEDMGYVQNAVDWYSKWEAVWEDNLSTCDTHGNCMIRPS